MLTGLVVYTYGSKKYRYNVSGVDTASTLRLVLESGAYDAMCLLSDPGCQDTDLMERRVDIGLLTVKTESESGGLDKKGKRQKLPVNWDFFCRLGSLVRYAKANCSSRNEMGYTGLELASGEFEARTSARFEVKFPSDPDRVFATLTLEYGNIQKLHLETDDFLVDLEDAKSESGLIRDIKNGVQRGFKFSSEYLGFPIPTISGEEQTDSVNGVYRDIYEIIKMHPEKEFNWLLGKDYRIVTDDTLDEVCDYIQGFDGYVYYDTETTGLNINFRSRVGQADQAVGIVLSVRDGESFYFPMQMKAIPNLCGGDHWYFMQHYMKPILEGKELVAHNMSFDWKVAYIYDINANIVHDTMALIKLTLGAEYEDYPSGLKELTKLLLLRDSLELSDLVVADSWGESDVRFWDLPYELVRLYACADTDNTRGLFKYAMDNDLLGKYNARKVYEIEIAFSFAVGYQEFMGHHLNIHNLDEIRKEIVEGQDKIMNEMVKIVGYEFNPNSSPALLRIMYNELGIPEQISRKTGRPTTDKDTLKKLAEITDEDDNAVYPFCALLLQYRELEGVRKVVDKFPEHVTEDGFIFSDVFQYGTTTGRVSIHNPNYQSYNDPIKKNVIPRSGYWAFDTDYSSVEYRVLGNMVGNKRIMKSFEDPDFDYHTYQAAHMYNVPYAAVTKKLRKAAKGINFGLPYGMGDESLGVRIYGEASPENTRKAAALRAAYFKGQEDIRDWFDFHRNRGVGEGFTETYFGRRRYYHKSKFSDSSIRRQAGNQVVQGCIDGESVVQEKVLGLCKLKNIAGQAVEVWDGADWTSGFVAYSGKKRKCVVKFRGGNSIVCSPEHKFLVRSHRGSDRFVACSDLIPLYDGDKVRKNAHRVVINQGYVPSEHRYSSKEFYGYKSKYGNANNVFIDSLSCDSFRKGVVLGRIASDGCYSCNTLDYRSIKTLVAEHEESILDILVDYEKEWGATAYPRDREDRNEVLYEVSVYSTSLLCELQALDIWHSIDDRIWADTEMLRGFLCGFFDGDGGISGKAITLVQGVQYDFEPLFKDIQRALTHFGIRSRYRKYDDRFVLQVKTTDNELFLDRIGFLNEEKQRLGRGLKCVEDEHVFGKCLLVESVEITDEYIDMYDVCNTEKGYYVVDGIITHNTAADIYKIAVGRVFKRICREGWLGKVLLTAFIHDELFGEVSNDIDPGVFLKVLREEFEVKISNSDGTPWSPLYMGFGYGRSWYEAKSVELPIKLQWEIVDRYGDSGFPDWDGDINRFCDGIPGMLRDFEIRDIKSQITASEAQGNEIKPALNVSLLDVCKEDTKEYNDMVSKALQGYSGDDEGKVGYLKGILGDRLLTDDAGGVVFSLPVVKTTQECLDRFCWLHGVDRAGVDLKDIAEYTGVSSMASLPDYEDEDNLVEDTHLMDVKVDTLGMYLDIENKMVILKMLPAPYMDFIKARKNSEGKGYRIRFKDCAAKKFYDTQAWLESSQISLIQGMYLQYFKTLH